jgi:hypothetical protein
MFRELDFSLPMIRLIKHGEACSCMIKIYLRFTVFYSYCRLKSMPTRREQASTTREVVTKVIM